VGRTNLKQPPDTERKLRRIKRGLANPIFFGEYYLAPYDPNWSEALPPFAHDMMRFIVGCERGVIMLPVEFLKTTLGSQLYPIWLTYRRTYLMEQLRGMLFSEEQGLAAANLALVAWHIEHNEHLAADFQDERGRPLVHPSVDEEVWREDAIVVQRQYPSKDPTWQAKGLDGKGIHGRRLDVVIGDDVVTPRNAHSPTLRKQALDTLDLSVATRVVAGGQIVMLGNFNDTKDLLSTLSRRRRWRTFKRPSAYLPDQVDVAPTESQLYATDTWRPTWPTNWTQQRLLEEYEDTPNRFRRIHLMDPAAERGERLQVGWLNPIDPEQTPLDAARIHMAIDAAPGGEGDDLDFVNISVGALHSEGSNFDLLGSIDFRAKLPQQIKMLGAIHDRFARVGQGVFNIAVYKHAMDNYLADAVEMGRADLVPLITPISGGTGTKEERLEALGPFGQSGWFRIWEEVMDKLTSDDADQGQELTFVEQWREFPTARHDDKLDGLWLLIHGAREFAEVRDVEFELEAH
jgi:hypothetical protein